MDDPTRARRSAFAKTAITISGFLVVVVGIFLLVLPGPGIVVIGAGLAILALEYDWAKRLLRQVRERIRTAAHKVTDKHKETDKHKD